ncbi:MAG: hypothetical protein WB987_15055 [Candidatus Acidiferrales bacterium]
MRISMRVVSLLPALLALALFSGVSIPAFASGDDKPAATAATAISSSVHNADPRPDREKKIYTNDDIDRMWPKQPLPAATAPNPQIRSTAISRAARTAAAPLPPEKDPLWYAQQVATLSSELDQIAGKEQRLRAFRASAAAPGPGTGLQLNAPCEGYTTDNEIAQLALRRQEIEQQIAALEDTAQQNDLPPGILRDAPAILAAAQKPLTPAEQQAAIEERQAQLSRELSATQDELAYMSAQATAAGANLLPPTPRFGGNMTTDLIERLDNRAGQIKAALDETEDAARQARASRP